MLAPIQRSSPLPSLVPSDHSPRSHPMGAAPDLSPSPPPPDRTTSPDKDALRDWKADMMSALGESISFGRFLTEPLEWGRWSAFEHKRYLEEAAGQSRPGSVAMKKAFFEDHYARKRKSADVVDEDAACGAAEATWSANSSCMTGEDTTRSVDSAAPDRGAVAESAAPGDASQELKTVANVVASSRRLDGTDARSHEQGDVQVADPRNGLQLGTGCAVAAVDAAEKQPLQESSIVNQGSITDPAKKKRHPMSSLFQKPAAEFSSPPSGKKVMCSSAKKWPAKENSSPLPSTDSNKQEAASVAQTGSTLGTLHMSMNLRRCDETGNPASKSRNLGSTIASRISQLESASRPVKDVPPKINKHRWTRKVFCKDVPEAASETTQQHEQRSPYVSVTRVKEKLFGSPSPAMHPKANIAKENMGKANDESELKEMHQSVRFKGRNFYWRNKESKDSKQQGAQAIFNPPNSDHTLNDASDPDGMSRGALKDKQKCCFPF